MTFDDFIFQELVFAELRNRLAEDDRFRLANTSPSDVYSISANPDGRVQAYSLAFSTTQWGSDDFSMEWTSGVHLVSIPDMERPGNPEFYEMMIVKGLPFQDPQVLVSMVFASLKAHADRGFSRQIAPTFNPIVSPRDKKRLKYERVSA